MRGDLDELLECLDPQAEWDLSNFGGWPEAQTYRGKAAVARFLADWTGFWESYEAGLDEMVEIAPDRVFAASWQRGYVAGSKLPIEQARLGSIATVRDGYIVRFEVWSDQDAAREAAFRR